MGINVNGKFLILGILAVSVSCIIGYFRDLPKSSLFDENINVRSVEKQENKKEPLDKIQEPLGKLYQVVRVVDGDTIIVNIDTKEERVRLIGVNTPESVKPDTPVQKYGIEASNFTKSLLKNKKVNLEFDAGKRDKYSRLLAYVYLPDGRMVNKILLEEGYAQVMTVPPNVKYQKEFLELQRKARKQEKGLWK